MGGTAVAHSADRQRGVLWSLTLRFGDDMHRCPSHKVHFHKTHSPKAHGRKPAWLPFTFVGAALLTGFLAWRSLRVYEPRPRQASEPPEQKPPSLNY